MYPVRRIMPMVFVLGAASCGEDPSTGLVRFEGDDPLDLDLVVPRILEEHLVTRDMRVLVEPNGAARVLAEHEAEYAGQDEASAVPGIWNAQSGVTFFRTGVHAWGEHDYVANKGRVDVTASIRRDGVEIGSRKGVTEQTSAFFPWLRHILGTVEVRTDIECGLAANADSEHGAWWEGALGTGPSTFGAARVTSSAPTATQPACPPPVPPTGGGSGGGGGGGGVPSGGSVTCYIWWQYDLATGEILDAHVLFCTEGG